jgi:hypothetical protein
VRLTGESGPELRVFSHRLGVVRISEGSPVAISTPTVDLRNPPTSALTDHQPQFRELLVGAMVGLVAAATPLIANLRGGGIVGIGMYDDGVYFSEPLDWCMVDFPTGISCSCTRRASWRPWRRSLGWAI